MWTVLRRVCDFRSAGISKSGRYGCGMARRRMSQLLPELERASWITLSSAERREIETIFYPPTTSPAPSSSSSLAGLQRLVERTLELYGHDSAASTAPADGAELHDGLVKLSVHLLRTAGEFRLITQLAQGLFTRAVVRLKQHLVDVHYVQELMRLLVESTGEGTGPGPAHQARPCPPWVHAVLLEILVTQWLPLLDSTRGQTKPQPAGGGMKQRRPSPLLTLRILKLYWELAHRVVNGGQGFSPALCASVVLDQRVHVPPELVSMYASFTSVSEASSQNGVAPLMKLHGELAELVDEELDSEVAIAVAGAYERRLLRHLCDRLHLDHRLGPGDNIIVGVSGTASGEEEDKGWNGNVFQVRDWHASPSWDSVQCLLRHDAHAHHSYPVWDRVLEQQPPYWPMVKGFLRRLPPRVTEMSVKSLLVSVRNVSPVASWGLLVVDECFETLQGNDEDGVLDGKVGSGTRAGGSGRGNRGAGAVGRTDSGGLSTSSSTSTSSGNAGGATLRSNIDKMKRVEKYRTRADMTGGEGKQSREEVCQALIKMAANRKDVYAVLEVVRLAKRWGVQLRSRDWALALHTTWASRRSTPANTFRSSFSLLLQGVQESGIALDQDTSQTIVQFLAETDPAGELTWRMLGQEVRPESTSSFVHCTAMASLILSSLDPEMRQCVELTEPMYESAKYLQVKHASRVIGQVSSRGRDQLPPELLERIEALWKRATAGAMDDWRELHLLLTEALGNGHLACAVDDPQLRDALSQLIAVVTYHVSFHHLDESAAFALMYRWFDQLDLRSKITANH